MSEPFGERLLGWLFRRRNSVREGGLFHELDRQRAVDEALEEVAEKLKENIKGYRNG